MNILDKYMKKLDNKYESESAEDYEKLTEEELEAKLDEGFEELDELKRLIKLEDKKLDMIHSEHNFFLNWAKYRRDKDLAQYMQHLGVDEDCRTAFFQALRRNTEKWGRIPFVNYVDEETVVLARETIIKQFTAAYKRELKKLGGNFFKEEFEDTLGQVFNFLFLKLLQTLPENHAIYIP